MKKGSMQLSINAIVILIMAIAMLGVGIYFIKSVLSDQLGSSIEISEEIKDQIRQQIRQSDQKLLISGVSDKGLIVPQKGSKEIIVAVGNKNELPLTFTVNVEFISDEAAAGATKLTSFWAGVDAETSVDVGDVSFIPVSFKAGTDRVKEIWKIEVWDTDDTDKPYATQTFFVTVQ